MIDVALTVMAIAAAGLTIELYAVAQAPLGYEDEHYLHLGANALNHREDCPSKQAD
jgi:hypothetical protein